MTNLQLSQNALITLSNLGGLEGPETVSSTLTLGGADADKFTATGDSAATTARAFFDADTKKLTMRVNEDIVGGKVIVFSFVLKNPKCAQESPAVCVRASRIDTPCLDCSLGECITLARQGMDRDYNTIFAYGTKGGVYGNSAYYSENALISYTVEPPQLGDAAPLKVYDSSIVVANITQSNSYPGATNTITVDFSTSTPLDTGAKVTIKGLTGSQTSDSSTLAVSTTNEFENTGEWDQSEGSFVLKVKSTGTTVAGKVYTFSISEIGRAHV